MIVTKEFKILNKTEDLYRHVRSNLLPIIPNVHRDLRIHLTNEVYSLVRNLLSASYNKGNVRNKYINDLIINISMLDFILGELSNISCELGKKCLTVIRSLTDIKNMIYAWRNNISDGKDE